MKYIPWIIALALMAIIMLMWNCPTSPVTSRADELTKQLDSLEGEFKAKDDSAKREIAVRDSIIADLMAEKEILSGELKVVGSRVTELTHRIRHAKIKRDTVTYYVSCDSLVLIADSLVYTVREYEYIVDSLLITQQEQSTAKDSMIVARDRLLGQVRGAFNVLADENRNLIQLYNKEKKKHKLSKKLNIVLGTAVVVLGGILIAN